MDTKELRNVFGTFVTGVTVVTTVDEQGQDQGVTANSFSSVSLDPPLVLWSQARSARSFPAFRDADHFIVNILAEHQRDLSQRFATPGSDKFAGIQVERRHAAMPGLPECCAWVECRKVAMYPGGDHVVFLGEVVNVERNDRRPLAFARGKYMLAFEHEMDFALPPGDAPHLAHNDAVRLACAALPELAKRSGCTVGVAVWGNRGATIIRWEPAARSASPELRTGVVMSPLTSAVGILFGAYLPAELTQAIVQEASMTSKVEADSAIEYDQVLARTRERGLATSLRTTKRGRYGLATPVFDSENRMVLALCGVIGSSEETEETRRLESELRATSLALSKQLGHAHAR